MSNATSSISLRIGCAIVVVAVAAASGFFTSAAFAGGNAVARLSDGRVLLLKPSGELLVSRTPHPISLADFAEPLVLFGEGGSLSTDLPERTAVAVESDGQVHLVASKGNHLSWYTTGDPASADSKWQRVQREFAADVRLHDLARASDGSTRALYDQTLPSGRRGIGIANIESDSIEAAVSIETDKPIVSAAATAEADGTLHVIWSESETAGSLRQATLRPGEPTAEQHVVAEGSHPDIVAVGGRTFAAWEQADGSVRVEWRSAEGSIEGSETLAGRGAYRPTLGVDVHGVVWLFTIGRDQHGLFYRRFLGGSGFGAEAECGIAPGAWKIPFDVSVQPAVGPADDGFALVHSEVVDDPSVAPRYRFHNIRVPRLSVRDDRRVLFLDMLEVAEMSDLKQTVATAVRSEANPLNVNGPPGSPDAAVAGYATVMHENGKFRMWYNADADAPGRTWVICYAESDDGVHWTKPSLGLVEHSGSRDNNLLFPVQYGTNTPLIIRDDLDPDPARRYKMAFICEDEGGNVVYMSWSADGLRWHWPPQRLWGKTPGVNHTRMGLFHPFHEPLSSFFYDPITPHPEYRWKLYGQSVDVGHPHTDGLDQRNVQVAHGSTPYEMKAFNGESVLDPRSGYQEDQIHGSMVQPYHGLYVGLYQHWWGKDWNVDLRLAVSRDGLHFVRIQPEAAVLPLGEASSWDSGMVTTPNFLLHHDGRLWLYYRGSIGTLATGKGLNRAIQENKEMPQSEGWRMWTGLARLREDGFTYLTVRDMENQSERPQIGVPKYDIYLNGQLSTIPIEADGIGQRELHVNVENLTPGFASLKAQLRDAESGEVIAGYSFADADALAASSLDERMTWKGSADLGNVQSDRIRVEFQLTGTMDSPRLYSFWFAEKQ